MKLDVKSYPNLSNKDEVTEELRNGNFTGFLSRLPNNFYHGLRYATSSSQLKYLHSKSPKHYLYNVREQRGEKKEPSKDMILGSLVHTLLLEADEFKNEFYVMPNVDRRTKSGKEEWAEATRLSGMKMQITSDQYDQAARMVQAVSQDERARELLQRVENFELSYFWRCPFTNLKLRARADGCSPNFLLEVKTTRSAAPSVFERHAYNMGYHISMAHYLEGLRVLTEADKLEGYFLVVETEEPYVVQTYKASDDFLSVGHSDWLDAMVKLEDGIRNHRWPGYDGNDSEMKVLDAPRWAKRGDFSEEDV